MKDTLHRAFDRAKHYAGLTWFKLALLVVLAVVLNRKDVSFTFNFNAGQTAELGEQSIAVSGMTTSPMQHHEVTGISSMAARPVRHRTPAELARYKKQQAYVARFSAVAIAEMKKYGIPASVTLAQGVVETNSGESTLASKYKNHFGIKCFSKKCSKGHCVNFSDNSHKDFFVRYESAWSSYRAHSDLLTGKRYRHLQTLGKDYKAWAKGLKEAGYATDPNYANKLIAVVEDLELYKYDK